MGNVNLEILQLNSDKKSKIDSNITEYDCLRHLNNFFEIEVDDINFYIENDKLTLRGNRYLITIADISYEE